MSDELYFDVELKKCLNTAAFSDDLWDWWYQRIHQAHDASVDRVTDTQRAENAKLRELVDLYEFGSAHDQPPAESLAWNIEVAKLRRELGIEVD